MGAANAVAGVTQGLPVGASGSRTAVNDAMGARSQIAGIVSAVAVALVLLFLTGPIAYLPKAVLGAVIVVASLSLVEREALDAAPSDDHALVLDVEGVSHIDVAGLDALTDMAQRLERDGIALHIARLKSPLSARVQGAGVIEPERFHPTVRAAVEAAALSPA
jgi:MFS superfamily sulfate permease-like transporter